MSNTSTLDGTQSSLAPRSSEWVVIVIDGGWVFIGKPSYADGVCTLYDGYNVRQYGAGSGVSGFVGNPDSLVLDELKMLVEIDEAKITFKFKLPVGWEIPS